jgi:hypothetical protein
MHLKYTAVNGLYLKKAHICFAADMGLFECLIVYFGHMQLGGYAFFAVR